MKSLITQAKEHKLFIAVLTCVLIGFVGFSIFAYTTHQAALTSEAQESPSSLSPEEEAVAKLSEQQRAKQNEYSIEIGDIISVLQANVWATEDKSHLLTFTTQSYTQKTSDGSSSTTAYVVDAIKTEKSNANDIETSTYTLAVEDSETSFFLTLTKEVFEDKSTQYFLQSDNFTSQEVYGPISSSGISEVKSLNSELVQLVGGQEKELVTTVQEYCSEYHPAAMEITWSQYATIEWSSNTVIIPFELDDNSNSMIEVVYDRSSKTFACYDSSSKSSH